ncbi:hypothetical protein FHS57_002627 [Runella defluvii]|uniref:Lipocalin-like domain-containing protein n=1 Tax=Runella defluvii TaxID=370973 RepID=A0A7W6EQP4_9BACT|nr:hypothetical protein [Runella defluvii]MBB3838621.1 hypothetical protein [Runella defluvii]
MKNVGWVFFLVLGVFSCKEKQLTPEEIQPLVGKWKLDAIEPAGDVRKWESVASKDGYVFEIRYDGVILDANGLPACCVPSYLVYQGNKFTIEPKEKLAPNPSCALVLCMACDTWYLELENGQLITNACNSGGRNRFTRL